MRLRRFLFPAVLIGSAAMAGCAGHAFVAVGEPPAPQVGVVGVAPGPGFIWIDGFYDLRGGRWVWSPGYWARPPHRHSAWVKPYWEHRGNRYVFHRGHWR